MRKKQTHPTTVTGFKKNQLVDLMQLTDRYTATPPILFVKCGQYDNNLSKSLLMPYLITEKEIEP